MLNRRTCHEGNAEVPVSIWAEGASAISRAGKERKNEKKKKKLFERKGQRAKVSPGRRSAKGRKKKKREFYDAGVKKGFCG